jgi:hypothetical protein
MEMGKRIIWSTKPTSLIGKISDKALQILQTGYGEQTLT